MSKYYQCSKCKKLKITSDIIVIEEIVCRDGDPKCNRRMRELTKDQYDHEVIQREHIDNSGPAPTDTAWMNKVNGVS
jgi:hypothetical protein